MKENKEAGISQNDSKKAERPERKKRTSVKENKKEKTDRKSTRLNSSHC